MNGKELVQIWVIITISTYIILFSLALSFIESAFFRSNNDYFDNFFVSMATIEPRTFSYDKYNDD